MTPGPAPVEHPLHLPAVDRRVEHARDVPRGLTLGRCSRCSAVYAWKGRDGARLADVPCLRCERCTLQQTSRRLYRPVEILDDGDVLLLARRVRAERRGAERRRIERGVAVRVRDLHPGTIVSVPGIVGRLRVLDLREPDSGNVWTIVGDEATGHVRTLHRNGRDVLTIVRPDRVVLDVPEIDQHTAVGEIRTARWHGSTVDARRMVLRARLVHVSNAAESAAATVARTLQTLADVDLESDLRPHAEHRLAQTRDQLDRWRAEELRVRHALAELDPQPHTDAAMLPPSDTEESTR